jgi:O-antigen/teichoic acid export membrane protein
MNGFRRALVLATSERYFCLAANFVSLAAISRLLSPSEIGVSVIGMATAAFAQSAREVATTNYIIQHKTLQREHVQVTFTILLLVSLAITSVLVLSAGALAHAYSEPRLKSFLYIAALAILLEAISAPVAALLRRDMAIGKLAIINMTGSTVNVVVTVALAVLGHSYMSMVWGWLISNLWISLASLLAWPDRTIFRLRTENWREAAAFGGSDGTNTLLFAIYDSVPYLILGRVLSFDAAAIYNRGVMLCRLPDKIFLGGLSSVILSAFSNELRNGNGLRAAYLRGIELLTGVVWPALLLLAILSEWAVQVLFGHQWLDAAAIVRIMALASLFSFSSYLNHPILLAAGATNDVFKRSLIMWPVSAVIVALGAFGGLTTASLAWFVTVPFQAYVSFRYVQRHINVSWQATADALQSSLKVAICSSVGPLTAAFLCDWSFEISSFWPMIAILLSAIGWAVGLYLTAHPLLGELNNIYSAVVSRLPRPTVFRAPPVECVLPKRLSDR